MYLIQAPAGGDPMLVESLDGHEGWAVLDDAAGAMTLDDAKQLKRSEVDAHMAAQFLEGFSPTSGPLVGHTLQVRDDGDRTNWLTSQAAYSAQVAAGNGATVGANFRTESNETVTCSFSDGLSTLLAMAAWGAGLFGKSWTLKDAVGALTDADAVLAYDVAVEWAAL